jgi:hypothetical protein
MHRLTLSLVLAAGTLAALPTQAVAADALVVTDGVLYDDCRMHPYSFVVTPPPGSDSWSMDVTAYGPDGTSQATDFVYDDISTGSGDLLFCGSEMAGAYQLVADVEYTDFDADFGGVTTERLAAPFTMRQPASRTSLKVSTGRPSYNSVVTFTVTSLDERPNGFFPTSYATVRLQRKSGGRWVNVPKAKGLTDERGRDVQKFRWNVRGRQVVRAITPATTDVAGSSSRQVTIRTR